MLSIFGRAGAILLAVVDVSHALYAESCVEGSTEAQHEAFIDKPACAHSGPVSNVEISIRSAVQQTLTTLKGCRAMIVG